ncbi:uncharacterized protein NESG_02434 [Nematocida ausubeli]|uniref:RING-type E3 ubiquitin transferase n=1 Tax=Nematocida ausubeli (strain ATCC PRA-371 / ERTm2) TaxID=1913371 RepID=A0A086IYZ4_NEMA1|nr:uncharacterized protein NESG_02434 [Nematocida ausubeli]KFG25112.1 hypothetical protein NESG_02434 [Nematocida ausubeli]
MYRHETYLAVYLSALCSICLADFINGKNLYESLVGLVENRVYHFLLSLFFIGTLYVLGRVLASFTMGELSALEKEGVQESGMHYIGNICLVVTLFSDYITIRTLVLFAFVFGLKVLHWLVGFRIDALEKSGSVCQRIERMVGLVCLLFVVDSLLTYQFITQVYNSPDVSILFAFEFFILFAYTIRSLYSLVILQYAPDTGIEDRVFLLFYGDFAFCIVKILSHIMCLVVTTMYFRMPINLLRETVVAIKYLITKTRSTIAYKSLITFIEGCPDVAEDDIGADRICLICHEEMQVGKKLECGHILHLVCLKEWLHRQQACPICRKAVHSKKEAQSAASTQDRREQDETAEVPSIVRVLLSGQSDEYEGVPVTINHENP